MSSSGDPQRRSSAGFSGRPDPGYQRVPAVSDIAKIIADITASLAVADLADRPLAAYSAQLKIAGDRLTELRRKKDSAKLREAEQRLAEVRNLMNEARRNVETAKSRGRHYLAWLRNP